MKNFFFFVCVSSLSVLSSQCAYSKPVTLPEPQISVLSNGMKIAWLLDENVPVIDLSITVQAGYKDDPEGKSGTAEIVAALLDHGSKGMSAHQLADAIESVAGIRFSSVSGDVISVGVHGLTADVGSLLEVLGKMVVTPEFPLDELQKERATLIERWSHVEDYPEALVNLAYRRMVFAQTVYGRGNILSTAELKKIQRNDVLNYYQKHFIPANSILTVVGQGDRTAIEEKIRLVFGDWRGPSQTPLHTPPVAMKKYSCKIAQQKSAAGNTQKQLVLVIERPHLAQAQIRLGSATISPHEKTYEASRVANVILGEMFNSRLNNVIRDELGLTYSIHSSLSYYKKFSEFSISTASQSGSVGALMSRLIQLLTEFSHGDISPSELEAAKVYLKGSLSVAHLSSNSVMSRWMSGIILGMGPNYTNDFMNQFENSSLSEVSAAARHLFDLGHLTIVVAGDSAPMIQSLKGMNSIQIKQVSAPDLK
jgi:zinc protease